ASVERGSVPTSGSPSTSTDDTPGDTPDDADGDQDAEPTESVDVDGEPEVGTLPLSTLASALDSPLAFSSAGSAAAIAGAAS
ncbi:hypothetical protein C6A85_10710, partial [Mycobacterium sp. ITM-2017-0098]